MKSFNHLDYLTNRKHHGGGGGVGDPHGQEHGGEHEAEHQPGLARSNL